MTKPLVPTASRPQRYGPVAQSLHWLTAILVLVAFLYGPGGPEARVYDPSRDSDRQLHEMLGTLVFTLVLVRVLWRVVDVRPDPPPVSRWMGFAAKAVQAALYVLLFALPATAATGAWLEGHALAYPGGFQIASPLPVAHDMGALIASVHSWLGDAIMWLAGMHALAALYHQFALHDGVLKSMLPYWLWRSSPR